MQVKAGTMLFGVDRDPNVIIYNDCNMEVDGNYIINGYYYRVVGIDYEQGMVFVKSI